MSPWRASALACAALAAATLACSNDRSGFTVPPLDLDASAPGTDAPVLSGSRSVGAPCTAAADCDSGFCVDGVCCNVACAGACTSCAQPDRLGQCSPIAANARDPHGVCKDQGLQSCGQSGLCNDQGGCARYPAGTVCRAPVCQSGSVMPAGTCDGNGSCVGGLPVICDPYVCAATACKEACQSDADCVAPATCSGGSCGKRGLGQTCKTADDCKSGFCADGVCCSEACAGKCRYCALATALGRCVNVPAGAPDPRRADGVNDPALVCVDQGNASCGNNGLCNGAGGCQRYAPGTICHAESCDAATNGYNPPSTCSADGRCVAPPSVGCAPFHCGGARCTTSCTTDADCVAPATCQGGSCGKRPTGQACTGDGDCSSGHCAQGVCCATTCTASCVSCALPGTLGACTPVSAGAADPTGGCTDQGSASCGNDGACNGAGACRKYAAGTVCGAATCSAGKVTAPSACNGAGACQSGATRACDPYLCNAAGTDCYNSCTDAGQCVAGTQCLQGRCGKKGLGAPCAAGTECTSGFCTDGVCCNSACGGTCVSCALGASAGTCTPIPAGMTDPDGSCGAVCTTDMLSLQDRRCDGAGACTPSGPAVSCNAYQCRSAACLTSCAVAGDCAPGYGCTNGSCVLSKKANGGSCTAGGECQSNNCVNSTCCAQSSCAVCSTCANAAGQCQPTTAGTACGAASCSADSVSVLTPKCDGAGTCANVTTSCGGYACAGGACKTTCTTMADCTMNYRCRGNRCRP